MAESLPSEDEASASRRRKLSDAYQRLKSLYTSPSQQSVRLRLSRSTVRFVNLSIVKRPQYKVKSNVCSFREDTLYRIDQYCSEESKKGITYQNILACSQGVSARRVVLSGSPGIGKTTLARKLCTDLYSQKLPNQYQLIVFVELRKLRFERSKCEIDLSFLLKIVGLSEVLSSLIEEQDGQGIALILDGFDEIADDDTVSHWLKNLFSRDTLYLNKCDMFVTTRPSQVVELIERIYTDCTLIEIVGFTSENIDSYIKSYPFSNPRKAEAVIQSMNSLPLVYGMCSNPILLEIVCKLHQHDDNEEPLPETLSGTFIKLVCRQLEEDLRQRQIPVRKITSLLDVPEDLFPGFYQLCEVAYNCCLEQRLILTVENLGTLKQYENDRGSIYNLLFSEEVESGSLADGILYQCDHKTVQETLAAGHIGHLSCIEQEKICNTMFKGRHMELVWKMYCGITRLKFVDVRDSFYSISRRAVDVLRSCSYKWDIVCIHSICCSLLMLSLYEAQDKVQTRQVLSDVLGKSMAVKVFNQYDVAIAAYALSCLPHLERVLISLRCHSVILNLQPLHHCLRKVKSLVLSNPHIDTVLAVLSGTVERLELRGNIRHLSSIKIKTLTDALDSNHYVKSLSVFLFNTDSEAVHSSLLEWVSRNKRITSLTFCRHKDIMLEDMPISLVREEPSQYTSCLKGVFLLREIVNLNLIMTHQQWRVVLSGLKEAEALKELSLKIKYTQLELKSSDVEVVDSDVLISPDELEEVIATHPQLVKIDVNSGPMGFKDFCLPIIRGAVQNKNMKDLAVWNNHSVGAETDVSVLSAVLRLLSSQSSDHITRLSLDLNLNQLTIVDADWCNLLLKGPMSRPICHLKLTQVTPAQFALLLGQVHTVEHLQELSITFKIRPSTLFDSTGHGLRSSDSPISSDVTVDEDPITLVGGDVSPVPKPLMISRASEVESSLAKCNLKKLNFKLQQLREDLKIVSLSVEWASLFRAALMGVASNPHQVDFVLHGHFSNGRDIIRTLPLPIQCKYEAEENLESESLLDQLNVLDSELIFPVRTCFIFSRQPHDSHGPAQEDLVSTSPLSPVAEAPKYFNSRDFMEKYSNFPEKVVAQSIASKLNIKKAIGDKLLHEIKDTYEKEAGRFLYRELLTRGTPSQIRTVCEVMRDEEGNCQMNDLGRDMLKDKDLLLPPKPNGPEMPQT